MKLKLGHAKQKCGGRASGGVKGASELLSIKATHSSYHREGDQMHFSFLHHRRDSFRLQASH